MADDFFEAVGEVLLVGLLPTAVNKFINREPERPVGYTPLKQPVPPRHIAYGRGRKPGVYLFYETVNNHWLDVLAFCDGRIGGYQQFYLDDDAVTIQPDGEVDQFGPDKAYGGPLHIYSRLGLPTETAYSEVIARANGFWTTDHRGDETATAALICQGVSQEKRQRIYPNGEPELSADAEWLCVYDWRDPAQIRTDRSTWQWSENPIVCWVHDEWARNATLWDSPTAGEAALASANKKWTRYFSRVLDILTDEADACDPIVNGLPRYTCFVWFETNTDRKSVREMFQRSCDGYMVERGDGSLILRCGRWIEPVLAITDDMVIDMSWVGGQKSSELVNQVKPRYTSPEAAYEIVDGRAITNQESVDRRGLKSKPLDYREVTNPDQAFRLGYAEAFRLSASHTGQLVLDLDSVPMEIFTNRFHRSEISHFAPSIYGAYLEFSSPEVDRQARRLTVDIRRVFPEMYDPGTVGRGPVIPIRPGGSAVPVPILIEDPVFIGDAIRFTLDGPLPSESYTPVIRWWLTSNPAAISQTDVELFAGPDDDFFIYSSVIAGVPAGSGVLTAQVAYLNGAGTLGDFTSPFLIDIDAAPSTTTAPTDLAASSPSAGVLRVDYRDPAQPAAYCIVRTNTTATLTGATATPERPVGGVYTSQSVDLSRAAGSYYVWVTAYDDDDNPSADFGPAGPVSVG